MAVNDPQKYIAELEQQLKQTKKARRELEFLNQLSQAISSTLEPKKIMETILSKTSAQIKASHASIMLISEHQANSLSTFIREKELPVTAALDTTCRTIAGWVTKYDDSVLENDILADSRFEGLQIVSEDLQSVLAVPLKVKGHIIGVMVYQNLKGQAFFTDEQLRLISIIATQSAQILVNAKIHQSLTHENLYLKSEIQQKYRFTEIIGKSPVMLKVFELLARVIPTDIRVVIEGETGTGKELIARAIHYNGPRADQKFLAIDCGALPENLLESELFGHKKGAFTGAAFDKKGLLAEADGGTLFLDEINNMSIALQAKFLRAIQSGEIRPVGSNQSIKVDVRIISASNQNLKKLVDDGTFREDLYYRLNVLTIKLPPLRERKEDLPALLEHFLKKFAASLNKTIHGFNAASMRILEKYHWPGNIRELENVVERVVALAGDDDQWIQPELLPEDIPAGPIPDDGLVAPKGSLQTVVEAIEQKMIKQALVDSKGNKTKAAASLGLSRRGLINKLERYKL